jgi:hypothetical protein
MNFKGVQTLWEKYGKSLKMSLDIIFTKVKLVRHTCMQDLGVPIQVSKWLDLKIRKEFEFENSNHTTLVIQTKHTRI